MNRHVMSISLLDDATVSEGQVQVDSWHGVPLPDGATFKDMLTALGWFDVAVEIEADAFGHAAVTKMVIHPESNLIDTSRNRKNFANSALTAFAMGEKKPTSIKPASPASDLSQLRDDLNNFPNTVQHVQELLDEGNNVVVVMGNGVVACHPYRKTNDAAAVAMALKARMVEETGKPLPIGPDGYPRFAYLAWKSTEPIDAPSEGAVVSLADPTDLPLLKLVESAGLGTKHKAITLDEVM
jgi:hypothetical protein